VIEAQKGRLINCRTMMALCGSFFTC